MKLLKPQILFLVLFGLTVWAGIGIHESKTISLYVNDSGDTAQVSLLHTFTAVDSFRYVDTFSYQADTSAHQTIVWTSPVHSMIITPTVDTASLYACSVGFASDTLGIAFDATGMAPVLATLIDSLVANLNGLAGLTDSVDFQDSVSYIKAVSLYSQKTFTGRWKFEYGITGGTGTIDTSSIITTLAMISDSMVAAINADAGLDSFVTAANSGDTGYTITSDDKGVLFYATTLNHADTGGTLAASQANVTSWSTIQDTFQLLRHLDNNSHNAILSNFRINASTDTTNGIGGSDSCYLWLYSTFINAGTKEYYLLDSFVGAVPGSLRYVSVANDTLLKEALSIVWRVADTASDTNKKVDFNMYYDINLYEK